MRETSWVSKGSLYLLLVLDMLENDLVRKAEPTSTTMLHLHVDTTVQLATIVVFDERLPIVFLSKQIK